MAYYATFFALLVHCLGLMAICNANTTSLPSFRSILVFGDSTVDVGNNNYIHLSLFKADHHPYGRDFPGGVATGRFTNGKLTPDFLASEFKIKTTTFIRPYRDPNLSLDDLRTGISFASGGSGYDDLTSYGEVLSVTKQIEDFRSYLQRLNEAVGQEEASKIVNESMVVISAGTNDFVFNFYDIPSRKFGGYNITEYQKFLQDRQINFLKTLYDLGCRTIVVISLPPIGCMPLQKSAKFSSSCIEAQNDDAKIYNQNLITRLAELEKSLPESKFVYGDIYYIFLDMIYNPQKYGFTVTTKGCCGTGLIEVGPLCNRFDRTCEDANQYAFWDSVHPSERTYWHIAQSLIPKIAAKFI